MRYVDLDTFIKEHIRHGQHWNKRTVGMQDAKWQTLSEDTFLGGCGYAAGSTFKVFETRNFETRNFGWIVFGPDAKDTFGKTPAKRILKW